MDYVRNVKEALKTTWEHKYLWALGIILAIFGGGSGSGGNSFNNNSFSNNSTGSTNSGNTTEAFEKLIDFITSVPFIVWVLIAILTFALLIIWSLIGIYLSSRAKAGLIASTKEIESGTRLSFGKAWALGGKKMKGLFNQNLLLSIPGFFVLFCTLIAVLVLFFPVYSSNTFSFDENLLLPIASIFGVLICSMLVFLLIFSIAQAFGSRIAVLEGKGAITSLKEGFKFFWRNFLEVFVSWLFDFMVQIGIGMASVVLFVPLAIVIVILFAISNPVTTIAGIVLSILAFIFLIFLAGPLTVWTEIYWTKVYLRISEFKKIKEKI